MLQCLWKYLLIWHWQTVRNCEFSSERAGNGNLIISTVGRPVQPEQIKKSQHQSRRVYSALDLTDAAVLVDIETEMDSE